MGEDNFDKEAFNKATDADNQEKLWSEYDEWRLAELYDKHPDLSRREREKLYEQIKADELAALMANEARLKEKKNRDKQGKPEGNEKQPKKAITTPFGDWVDKQLDRFFPEKNPRPEPPTDNTNRSNDEVQLTQDTSNTIIGTHLPETPAQPGNEVQPGLEPTKSGEHLPGRMSQPARPRPTTSNLKPA